MRYMNRWSRMDLELSSIPWAAADRVMVQGIFGGLDLDGFDGSSSTVGTHLVTCALIQ